MNRGLLGGILLGIAMASGPAQSESHYSAADFSRVRKLDAHVHANTDDHDFL
jgi:hypothetical protein